jgi:hypothetical protein
VIFEREICDLDDFSHSFLILLYDFYTIGRTQGTPEIVTSSNDLLANLFYEKAYH